MVHGLNALWNQPGRRGISAPAHLHGPHCRPQTRPVRPVLCTCIISTWRARITTTAPTRECMRELPRESVSWQMIRNWILSEKPGLLKSKTFLVILVHVPISCYIYIRKERVSRYTVKRTRLIAQDA